MFSSANVPMILKRATMVAASNAAGEATNFAECQLLIEPFDEDRAQELGDEVASHLFTEDGALRPEPESIQLDPRVPLQAVTVSPTVDGSHASGTLRLVEFGALKVTKKQDEKSGKEWLAASQVIRFDLAPTAHRELLVMYFGRCIYLTFEKEQGELLGGRSVERRVLEAVEALRPKRGSGIESVTITAGGQSATLKAH